MAREGSDAAGMTPLQRLILDRMREKKWDPKDVEARGVKHATLHRYMNPVVLRQLPRPDVIKALADGLMLPVAQVRAAAMASVEGSVGPSGDSPGFVAGGDRVERPSLSDYTLAELADEIRRRADAGP